MKKRILLLTFIPLFTLYGLTSSSTVYWQDSGLYLSGVKTLGIIYPPGNTLYLILAFLWTRVFALFNFGMNFTKTLIMFSAFWGALASFVVGITVFELLVWFAKKQLRRSDKADVPKIQITFLISVVVGLLAGSSYSLWSQSINTEVYSMVSFFASLIFYFLFKIIILTSSDEQVNRGLIDKYIILIFITFGLSISVHPLTILFAPVLVIFGYLNKKKLSFYLSKKYLLKYLIIATISFILPFLYFPIRSSAKPDFDWSRISNLGDLINYLLAKGYFTGQNSITLFNFKRALTYPQLLFSELNIFGLALLLLGSVFLIKLKERKQIFTIIYSSALIFYLVLSIYNQGTEYNYWLIVIYNLFYITIGIGIWHLLEILHNRAKSSSSNKYLKLASDTRVVLGLGLVMIFVSLCMNMKYNNRRNYTLPQVFGTNILKNLPENAILFTVGDQDSSITSYLQIVQSYRKDVIIVWSNSFLDEWKMQRLKEHYPDLYLASFSPDIIDNDKAYNTFANDFFSNNLKKHRIFLIQNSVVTLPDNFQTVPAGAIWEVIPKGNDFIDLSFWNYDFDIGKVHTLVEKKEGSKKVRNTYGIIVGSERVKYSDEAKNFELQSYKNLADVCFNHFENKTVLNVINKIGIGEKYLGGQLLLCARDNYQKLVDADPTFFRADVWKNREAVYKALGQRDEARKLEIEAAVKANTLKN